MDEQRLEALRFFTNMRGCLPIDEEDWALIANMAAYLRDGSIPEFEDDDLEAGTPAALEGENPNVAKVEATDLASDGTISGGITVIEQH